MHIPDGYLNPAFSLGLGVVTIPVLVAATRKVQDRLDDRAVPLLAVSSAMSFTIMMFNVPVPGGTTAHGVGGTLIATVLGPWAAALCVTVALIIQALFFGDGGILALPTNALNMAIILPFVGYGIYRLLAGRSSMLSTRRVWAAGIGAYVGISVAALACGTELGVQPDWFTDHGRALYSPYDLSQAVPAMLAAHMFGASIVEAVITALGFAYLQKNHPEYLMTSLAPEDWSAAATKAAAQPFWRVLALGLGVGIPVFFAAGLMSGHGKLSKLFGADWSQVSWSDVRAMLLCTFVIAIVVLPLAWFALPKQVRPVGTALTAIAILAPLGLIAPGFAYGEGSAEDVKAAFGYVPKGLRDLSGLISHPLDGYNVQLPFFSGGNAPLWHQAIGYEISGMAGILLLVGLVWGLATLLRRGRAQRVAAAEISLQ